MVKQGEQLFMEEKAAQGAQRAEEETAGEDEQALPTRLFFLRVRQRVSERGEQIVAQGDAEEAGHREQRQRVAVEQAVSLDHGVLRGSRDEGEHEDRLEEIGERTAQPAAHHRHGDREHLAHGGKGDAAQC